MRRILAEVLEVENQPAESNEGGLPWRRVRCLVKAGAPIPEKHALPADIDGQTLSIERQALFAGEYPVGSKVVLTPEESHRLVARPANYPDCGKLRGRTLTYKTDINGDGFAERIVENSFLRVVIGPRFGARIWEVWHKRRDSNPLSIGCEPQDKWIDLGGQSDHSNEEAGADTWHSEFKELDVTSGENGFSARYEYVTDKPKGLTIVKEIMVPVDAPIVAWRVTFKYAGAEKPPEDGKPDELSWDYKPRVGLSIGSDTERTNEVTLSTHARMVDVQHEPGSWSTPVMGLAAPYWLARNVETGFAVAGLVDHAETRKVQFDMRPFHYVIEPVMETLKIAAGTEASRSAAMVFGDAVWAGPKGCLVACAGREEEGESPVCAVAVGPDIELDGMEASRESLLGSPEILRGTAWGDTQVLLDNLEARSAGESLHLTTGGEL